MVQKSENSSLILNEITKQIIAIRLQNNNEKLQSGSAEIW